MRIAFAFAVMATVTLLSGSVALAKGGGGHGGSHGGSHSSHGSSHSSGSHGARSSAPVHVKGHTTKNGTYVQGHMRSHPDGNPANNWSTKGNINPYTGKPGTKSLSPSLSSGPRVTARTSATVAPRLYARGQNDDETEIWPGDAEVENGASESVRREERLVERKPKRPVVEIPEQTPEEIASSNLAAAMQLHAAGKTSQAKRWLTEIQREYPETNAAAEAAGKLATLNRPATPPHDFRADVVSVEGGDSITVEVASHDRFVVRLLGISAPREGEPFADESKKRLSDKVLGKRVLVRWSAQDGDSLLGNVWLEQRFINLEMVRDGMARYSQEFSTSEDLERGERQARGAKLGIWRE